MKIPMPKTKGKAMAKAVVVVKAVATKTMVVDLLMFLYQVNQILSCKLMVALYTFGYVGFKL